MYFISHFNNLEHIKTIQMLQNVASLFNVTVALSNSVLVMEV